MKFFVDEIEVFELTETKKKVIQNEILSSVFEDDMRRRVKYIVQHKYQNCFERLKKHWEPKLKGRVESVPLDEEAFANLVFSQEDYKDRTARFAEQNAREIAERS